MALYRLILSLIIVFVATFLVSCGSPTVAKALTYTAAQIEQIQQYVPDMVALRDRMSELLIKRRDWIDVNNFIHGPRGAATENDLRDSQPLPRIKSGVKQHGICLMT